MSTFIPVTAVAALLVIASFSSAFAYRPAGGHRSAMMSGTDATYGSTGKCKHGDCSGKLKAKGMAAHKKN